MTSPFKLCLQIGIDNSFGLFLSDETRWKHEEIGIIVLACERCKFRKPAKGCPDTLMLVEGDLHSVAGPAHSDSKVALPLLHSQSSRMAEIGIITGIGGMGSEIHYLIAERTHVGNNLFLQLKSSMVRGKSYFFHGDRCIFLLAAAKLAKNGYNSYLCSSKEGIKVKIAIVGTGYVGLVTGACFADMGVEVTCIDVDSRKIEGLKRGIVPIYEPGLEQVVSRNSKAGRLRFSTSLDDAIDEAEIIFNAVGTPPDEDGSADLSYVLEVARTIGQLMKDYKLVVTKSTVPVGTSAKVRKAISTELEKRGLSIPFDVASNPEFLKEGAALKDFMSPDRVVVGVDSPKAKKLMEKLYRPFLLANDRMLYTDIPSAEMIKYAANAMLATRISFMNDIANVCDLVGADVNMVRKGIGADARIGTKFLYPGCGYGGSCFPKDVKAIIQTARGLGYEMKVLQAVEEVNERQKRVLFEKLLKHFGNLNGHTIALWGLSFKPETDDMREAPSIVLVELLKGAGANVQAYDPIAMPEAKRRLGDKLTLSPDMYEATKGADALILLTEWKEFRVPAWKVLKKTMKGNPVLLDGRNIYDRKEAEQEGFTYYAIGK